jgi:hypothetical protein
MAARRRSTSDDTLLALARMSGRLGAATTSRSRRRSAAIGRRQRSRRANPTWRVPPHTYLLLFGITLIITVVQLLKAWVLLLLAAAAGAWLLGLARRKRQQERAAARRRQNAQELGHLLALHPQEFEIATRDVLAMHGFRLQPAGGTRDRGIVLVDTDATGARTVVQCKRYGPGRTVGGPEVRALLGAMTQACAHRGLLVTTATFTSPDHSPVG